MDKLLPLIESLMSRNASEFSEISQVYFRAGWKELTAVMNWSIASYDFLAQLLGECLVVRHRGLRRRGCEE